MAGTPRAGSLVLEVLAYPLDEAASGTTDRGRVTLHADGPISVEDNGRGTATRYDLEGKHERTGRPLGPATREPRQYSLRVTQVYRREGGSERSRTATRTP
jgi:hypothetical protein